MPNYCPNHILAPAAMSITSSAHWASLIHLSSTIFSLCMSCLSALKRRQVCAGRQRQCQSSQHSALAWRSYSGNNELFQELPAKRMQISSTFPTSPHHSERLAFLRLLQYLTLSRSDFQPIAPLLLNNFTAN